MRSERFKSVLLSVLTGVLTGILVNVLPTFDPSWGGGGFMIGLAPGTGTSSINSTTAATYGIIPTSGVARLAFDGATMWSYEWQPSLSYAYDPAATLYVSMDLVCTGGTSQSSQWGLRIGPLTGDLTTAPNTLLDAAVMLNATTAGAIDTVSTHTWALSNAEIGAAVAGTKILLQLYRDAGVDASTLTIWVTDVRVHQ